MTYVTLLFMPDHDPIDDLQSVSDQALAWLARLKQGEVSKSDRQRFQDWCASDPSHKTAYDRAEQFWQLLEAPALNVHARLQDNKISVNPSRAGYWTKFAQAACLVLALAGLTTMLPNLIQDWQSDYKTAAGERRLISLEDGSRLTLNTGSAVTVEFSAAQRKVKLLRGEAFFEVAANKARPFIVLADKVSARAVGTAFSVSALDGNQEEVVVSEGVVAVTAGVETRQLSANKHIRWDDGGLESVQSVDTENRLAWRHGQVVFSRQPVAEVIQEVNRYRRWPIIIADRTLANRIISGVFKTDDPKAVISALTHTLSAQAVGLSGGVVLIY